MGDIDGNRERLGLGGRARGRVRFLARYAGRIVLWLESVLWFNVRVRGRLRVSIMVKFW